MTQSPAGNGNTDNSSQTVVQTPPAGSQQQNAQAPSVDAEAQQKIAALEQEAAEWKGRAEKRADEINRLKAANGTDQKPDEQKPSYVTRDDLSQAKWELKNEKKIALAGDEYQKLTDMGLKPDMALELALSRKGLTNPQSVSDALRQAESSSAPSVVDRSGSGDNRTEQERQTAQRMGITAEDFAKYGERASRMITRVGV